MTNQEIPRIFVSYAHDSIEHKNNVWQLADVLLFFSLGCLKVLNLLC